MILPNPHLLQIRRDDEQAGDRRSFIRLDRNERVSPLPQDMFQAMIASLRPEDLLAYPDPGPLIQRISRHTGLPPDHLCVTAGSDGAIRRLFQSHLRAGDPVVMPDPSYAMYGLYTRIFQATAVPVANREDLSTDLKRFHEAIVEGVRLVVIANPAQPTGGCLSLEEIYGLADRARQAGALCIVDEAYYPFHPETAIGAVPDRENLVVIRSFSKAFGLPGVRLGYAAAQPHILQGLHAVRGNSEVSALALSAGCFLMDHPDIVEQFAEAVAQGRALLCSEARRLGFYTPPCHANFQILQLPDDLDSDAIVRELRAKGYLVKGSYRAPGLESSIRVSLDGPEVIGPFCRALAEVVGALRP